jgi:class 3 adenylate cyclase
MDPRGVAVEHDLPVGRGDRQRAETLLLELDRGEHVRRPFGIPSADQAEHLPGEISRREQLVECRQQVLSQPQRRARREREGHLPRRVAAEGGTQQWPSAGSQAAPKRTSTVVGSSANVTSRASSVCTSSACAWNWKSPRGQ